eukprot:202376_1
MHVNMSMCIFIAFFLLQRTNLVSSNCHYNQSSLYCSGHGEYNAITQECDCDKEYGLHDCSQQYQLLQLPTLFSYTLIATATIIVLCSIVLMIWVHTHRTLAGVKAMSVLFTQMTLIGCVLISMGAIMIAIPFNDITCVLLEWLHFVGICMAIACSLLKAYRIAVIFGNNDLSPEPLSDVMLVKRLGVIMTVLIILLTAYTVCNAIEGGTWIRYNADTVRKEIRCNSKRSTLIAYFCLVVYPCILVVFLLIYARRTRYAARVFRETQCNYTGAYIGSTGFFVFGIVILFTPDYILQVATRGFGSLLLTLMVLLLLFYPKFRMIYGTKKNETADNYGRKLLRQYKTNLKDPSGNELLVLFDALTDELEYRMSMGMLDVSVSGDNIERCAKIINSLTGLKSTEK